MHTYQIIRSFARNSSFEMFDPQTKPLFLPILAFSANMIKWAVIIQWWIYFFAFFRYAESFAPTKKKTTTVIVSFDCQSREPL